MVKKLSTILLLSLLLIHGALAQAVGSSCDLMPAFSEWKRLINLKPRYSFLKDSVNYGDYLDTARAFMESDGFKPSGQLYDEHIELMATTMLYQSAWFDSRIAQIEDHLEVCQKSTDRGELVFSYTDDHRGLIYKIIPFRLINGHWMRSLTLTPGYSNILDLDAKEAILNSKGTD